MHHISSGISDQIGVASLENVHTLTESVFHVILLDTYIYLFIYFLSEAHLVKCIYKNSSVYKAVPCAILTQEIKFHLK